MAERQRKNGGSAKAPTRERVFDLHDNIWAILHEGRFQPLRNVILLLISFNLAASVFVMGLVWFSPEVREVLHVDAATYTYDDQADFDQGTYSDTEFDTDRVELDATGISNGTGTYTSDVIDAGISASWDTMTWTEDLGPKGEFRMEVGSATIGETFTTVNFAQTYTSPVIVAIQEESANTEPVSIRMQSLGSSSVQIRLQSPSGASLSSETVRYMVVEEGTHETPGGILIEADTLDTSIVGSKNNGWTGGVNVNYATSFPGAPAVHHQVMTYNDSSWIESYVTSQSSATSPPTSTGFEIALNGAEATDSHGATETIGWIAIETGTDTLDGIDWETTYTADAITGHGTCVTTNFAGTYASAPIVIGEKEEADGGDGGWAVTCSVSSTNVGFHAEEDQELDAERTHTGETFAFSAFESAFNYGSLDVTFQVRSCDDAACSGETFVGPDGTAGTVFTDPSSATLNVSDNQYFQFRATFTTDDDGFTPDISAVTINNTLSNMSPVLSFNSAAQKTDGSGTVDLSFEATDSEGDDVRAKFEYDVGAACDGPWLDPTLDESVVATADFVDGSGPPSVENDDAYQVGSVVDERIVTNFGSNTITVDWDSATDLPTTSDTVCLRLTGNDDTTDQQTPATQTLTIDNVDPSVSSVSVSPSTGIIEVGNIATITLDAGETGLSVGGGGCLVNGQSLSANFSDNGDGTYRILYAPGLGDGSWASGALSIGCELSDAAGNTTSVTSFTDSNTLSGDIAFPGDGGGDDAPACPSITGIEFEVNDGGNETVLQTIEIDLAATNATQVILSESVGFVDASYESITTPRQFTLSEGFGEKQIFAQFKSDCRFSPIFSDFITYRAPETEAEEDAAAEEQGQLPQEGEETQETVDDESEEDTSEPADTTETTPGSGVVTDQPSPQPAGPDEDAAVGSFIVVETRVEDENPSSDSFETNLANEVDDFYVGATLEFQSGFLRGHSRDVIAYNGNTKRITVDPPFEGVPEDGDVFSIVKQTLVVEIPTLTEPVAPQITEEEAIDVFRLLQEASTTIEDIEVSSTEIGDRFSERIDLKDDLAGQSDKIRTIIEEVGLLDLNAITVGELLEVDESLLEDPMLIQDKATDLRAMSSVMRLILENRGTSPVAESYMSFGSVELNFIYANPLDEEHLVRTISYLPGEVQVDEILSIDGLSIEFDPDVDRYVVMGEQRIPPGGVVVRTVAMQDVWRFEESDIAQVRATAMQLADVLEGTSFGAQAILLSSNVILSLDLIEESQAASYTSPQKHIFVYRENVRRLERAEAELHRLQDFTVTSSYANILDQTARLTTLFVVILVIFVVFTVGLLILWPRHAKKTTKNGKKVAEKRMRQSLILLIGGIAVILGGAMITVILVFTGRTDTIRMQVDDIARPAVVEEEIPFEVEVTSDPLPVVEQEEALEEAEGLDELEEDTREEVIEPEEPAVLGSLTILETELGFLNVRSGPASSNEKVAEVEADQEYDYISIRNGWYEIQLTAETTGWVSGTYITRNE